MVYRCYKRGEEIIIVGCWARKGKSFFFFKKKARKKHSSFLMVIYSLQHTYPIYSEAITLSKMSHQSINLPFFLFDVHVSMEALPSSFCLCAIGSFYHILLLFASFNPALFSLSPLSFFHIFRLQYSPMLFN